ncbi:type II toxin-antitoxin system VapC family toxin [Rhodohalobacter sp. 8-1]|uniref:type II toxin-antitoxin system VapC family toxin n=1 Tax=Rhodohalobacter sp. 8-1 TaxID=3131972 RepID=UPI0030EEC807
MGVKYLWDTHTVIYYLQQQFPPSSEKFIDKILDQSEPAISAITEIELLCWNAPKENDMVVIQNFIDDSLVFELEKNIKLETAKVRKASKIKLPDAIIAATAILYDLTLLTRNVSDFKNINQLNLINPHKQ